MHDHGGGGGGDGADLNLLPLWLQVIWVLALAAVTAGHLLTLGFARGQARAWTATHVLMGVGMLYMFLPWSGAPIPAGFWLVAFAGLGALVAAVNVWARGAPERLLWVLATVDMAAMTYMFLLFDGGLPVLTYALVAWYLAAAVGWSSGVGDVSLRRCCVVPFVFEQPVPPPALARAGQAVMAVAMAWMFLVMDPHAGTFFGNAFTAGFTEQTWWAAAFAALFLRVAADPVLVRRVGAPVLALSAPGPARAEPGGPGLVDRRRDVELAGRPHAGAVQLAGDEPGDVAVDLYVHAGEGSEQIRA